MAAVIFDKKDDFTASTTRHPDEVQDAEVNAFAQKLAAVFAECYRVLRENGLMIFSYHHSRNEGWLSVADAVFSNNFSFVQAQPIKAEMSVATPKSQASSPIDLDVFLVCRKRENDRRSYLMRAKAFETAYSIASAKIKRFNRLGRRLSQNDIKVVFYSQLLVELSPGRSKTQFCADFEHLVEKAKDAIDSLWQRQAENHPEPEIPHYQLALF